MPHRSKPAIAIVITLAALLAQPTVAAPASPEAPTLSNLADGPTPGKPPTSHPGLIEWLLRSWF